MSDKEEEEKEDRQKTRHSGKPDRDRRGIYIQKKHSNALDQVILQEKMIGGANRASH